MCFDRAEGDEQGIGYFLIREPSRHQFKYLVLSLADAKAMEFLLIQSEIRIRQNNGFPSCQSYSRPHPKGCEEQRQESNSRFHGKIMQDKTILDHFQQDEEQRHCAAIHEDGLSHGRENGQ